MKIGELAKVTGVSRDTIRFYERNGLIESGAGTSATNSYRDYPQELVFRLGFIQSARDAGMSVADIRDMIDALGGGCEPSEAKAILGAKVVELEANKEQITRVIEFLKAQIAELSSAPTAKR